MFGAASVMLPKFVTTEVFQVFNPTQGAEIVPIARAILSAVKIKPWPPAAREMEPLLVKIPPEDCKAAERATKESTPVPLTITGPTTVKLPVLATANVPPVVIASTVKVVAVLVRATFELSVAAKLPTVFAPLSVVPETALVVNKPVVLISPAPLSAIAPVVSIRLTAPPLAAANVPVMLTAPALFTVIEPPPELLIEPSAKVVTVLVRLMLPLVILVAMKEPIALAPLNVTPPCEIVVRDAAVIDPLPLSLTVSVPVGRPKLL